jgi:serine/threonine protein kinase
MAGTSNQRPSTLVRTYHLRTPKCVSEIIDVGATGFIGRLQTNPSRVLKFCIQERKQAVQQLEQEKRIYSIIGHHPLIAHVHSASDEGICFEYYPLGSLRHYYESCPSIPDLHHRLRWSQQSISAFKYLHSKYIIHGDISARNILLSSSMSIKVCDFGFSRIAGQALMGLGETRYCRFRPLTENDTMFMDDLFAIGSLLYEILTGNRPYANLDSVDVEARYKSRDFPETDDIQLYGHALVIRNCWNEYYRDIRHLEQDLPVPGGRMDNQNNSLESASRQIDASSLIRSSTFEDGLTCRFNRYPGATRSNSL